MTQEPIEPDAIEELTLEEALEKFRSFVVECRSCQQEAAPYWQFCAHCGVRLATQCPGCGSPLPPYGAHFCPHCGLEIPQAQAES